MRADPRGTGSEATDLLQRIQFASDSADACHRVLEEILQSIRSERAVVVLRYDDELRAVGFGVAEDRIRRLEQRDEAAELIKDLLDAGEGRVLENPSRLPGIDFERCRVVPFPGPRGVPAGLLLVEEAPGDTFPDELTRVLQGVGPSLFRTFGLEVQESRHQGLAERNDLLDSLVDTLSDPVVLTDHQNNVLLANRRAEQLLHAGPGESEGRRRAVRVNDLLFSSFLTQAVMGGDEPDNRELNLVDPADGSDLLFEVISVPVEGGGTYMSVLRDITDLKRALTELEVQFSRSRVAERKARRDADRLNVILANVGDPILVTDEDSKIVLMNAEAERLFDPSHTEDDGSDKALRAIRANDTKLSTLMSDFLLQKESRRVENIILSDPVTGEELPVEVLSSKISGETAHGTVIVSILHDLTQMVENQRLTRELQLLNDELEDRIRLATEELAERNRRLEWQSRELQKASRLKSEFLASMSHELRTPINAMLGYTSLLREHIYGELNERQENALQKVHGASQHLLALINDILDLSRIEAGRMPLRAEEVRLDAVIQELSQTIEPMVREKEIDYRTELGSDIPVMLTDRTKVKQILLNLLSNAVKFTNEGAVTVSAEAVEGGERIRIVVRDTGIGIGKEDRQTIFDDFRQVDQSSTRKHGGTGLGLSITRKLVELMDGSIGVESEREKGSTFKVELPARLPDRLLDGEDDGRD